MTAGSAASRRVLGWTPVAPLPASSPTRPTGITGRMSAPPETSSPGVCSFRLPQMCGFRLPLTRFSHRFKFRCRCSGRDQLASASAATSPSSVTLRRGWSRRPRPGPFRPTSPGALRPGSAAPGCWRFLQQSRPCLSRDEFVKRLKVVLHLFQLVRCARGGNIERSHELEVRAHLALNFLT